jgi:hypothetical protein
MSYTIEWEGDPPDTIVDLGGGMVVPLAELAESASDTTEPSSAVTARHGTPATPAQEQTPGSRSHRDLPHSCRCGKRWSGSLTCHCPTCHLTFSGVTHFDRHRRNGQCLDPADIGLIVMAGRAFECWGETHD